MNMEEISKNIKSMSDNNEVITTESGIIIHGYSTKSQANDNIQIDAKYSFIDLGECETIIKQYYNLKDTTELYILGIDSPNKNKNSSTYVYNFEIYLENGTQLEYATICKDSKISISSSITNPELVKLEEANYFSNFGYDIYTKNSSFYEDNCSPAYIYGNDITLDDRKKYFYPSNVSLCNDSCLYSSVNFTTQRFICECQTSSNISEYHDNEINDEIEKDDKYIDYFLSLINYRIIICYKFFSDFGNYYANGGFYISISILLFCLTGIIIFLIFGMKRMNIQIIESTPNTEKLKVIVKQQEKKRKSLIKLEFNGVIDPPKRNNYINAHLKSEIGTKNKLNIFDIKEVKKEVNNEIINYNKINRRNTIINRRKAKNKNHFKLSNPETIKFKTPYYKQKSISQESIKSLMSDDSKPKEISSSNIKQFDIYLENEKDKKIIANKINIINNLQGLIELVVNDEEINKKELNIIPFTKALRVDKRNFFEIFLSVLAHEIKIIDIFYYRSIYTSLSITLSIYAFESCLDVTLNCLLYTDNVVSEKYNNNGSIKFFTSLSLSFISNIIAYIISRIVGNLADYGDMIELIIKDTIDKKQYFDNIVKFKKYLTLKLTAFYLIQTIINLSMCYYLVIFCSVYHKTQLSVMINYIIGLVQSIIISLVLSLLISFIRFIGIRFKCKSVYYTSKFLFEKF